MNVCSKGGGLISDKYMAKVLDSTSANIHRPHETKTSLYCCWWLLALVTVVRTVPHLLSTVTVAYHYSIALPYMPTVT